MNGTFQLVQGEMFRLSRIFYCAATFVARSQFFHFLTASNVLKMLFCWCLCSEELQKCGYFVLIIKLS